MRFICTDAYKGYCQSYISYHTKTLVVNASGTPNVYFATNFHIEEFARDVLPTIKIPSVFISGGCDWDITLHRKGVATILESPMITRWLANNVQMIHPKLISVPVGIGFDHERSGAHPILAETMEANLPKKALVYASYTLGTNTPARKKCFEETDILYPWTGFRENLEAIARSLFVISPCGGGVDCYRHWEALYLKTIPIVTDDNLNIRFYRDLPFVLIKDWSEFKTLKLGWDLYHKVWNNFDVNRLDFDNYLKEALTKKNPLL